MTSTQRSLILAAVHVALLFGIAGRYALDRIQYPRQWFLAEPYDPNLPIRGRYVSLRLLDVPANNHPHRPVAFFIPEHVPDPSVRAAGEELWVEATVPPDAPVRPIRIGIKKDGTLRPCDGARCQ
jgi:hypothetical protein